MLGYSLRVQCPGACSDTGFPSRRGQRAKQYPRSLLRRNLFMSSRLLAPKSYGGDNLSPQKRSERMGQVHGKNTKPEFVVRRLVHSLGYRYRLHSRNLPGTPDLVFAGRKKVIFVHGCFWHRHIDCRLATTPVNNSEFWAAKFEANKQRDMRNIKDLMQLGWKVHVVWQCQLKTPDIMRKNIVVFLEQ